MPYGRIQGQGQGHEPIQGSSIENLQSREVDRQSPTGLIFAFLRYTSTVLRTAYTEQFNPYRWKAKRF